VVVGSQGIAEVTQLAELQARPTRAGRPHGRRLGHDRSNTNTTTSQFRLNDQDIVRAGVHNTILSTQSWGNVSRPSMAGIKTIIGLSFVRGPAHTCVPTTPVASALTNSLVLRSLR
jgi:hypothetical protein